MQLCNKKVFFLHGVDMFGIVIDDLLLFFDLRIKK